MLKTVQENTHQWLGAARRISLSEGALPFAFFAILFFTFGLLIPRLGFYQDDWNHIFYGHALGLSSLWKLYLYDGRPLAAAIYYAGFALLGFQPLAWQFLSLSLRFLTVLMTWQYLRVLWPQHKRETAWMALIFAVYPLFKLQPMGITYTLHWLGFFLFSVSIWAMIQSIRQAEKYWLFLGLAVLTNGLHLALIEYFFGLELVRPLLLWLLLASAPTVRARLAKVLQNWLPYALVLAALMVYRIFLTPAAEPGMERNVPTALFDLLRTPLAYAPILAQSILQDTLYILVTAWNNVFSPDLFALTKTGIPRLLVFIVLAGVGIFLFLRALRTDLTEAQPAGTGWLKQAFLVGLALTVLGPVPAWMTGRSISQDNLMWSTRLGMAAMVGASILVVASLELLVTQPAYRRGVFAGLLAFACGWHLFYDLGFRDSWLKQTQFYYQLYWRAPYLLPKTALLADQEVLPFMGEYPTAMALGSLYSKTGPGIEVPYWFYNVPRRFPDQIDDLVAGIPFSYTKFYIRFQGNSRDSIAITYAPEEKQCLWVLGPADSVARFLSTDQRELASVSNLSQIALSGPAMAHPDARIFGPEPDHSWCYYYEKGALAAQYKQWEEVTRLWKAADLKRVRPQHGMELLPFIQGFAYQGDWGQAYELSLRAYRLTNGMKTRLCPLWDEMTASTPASAPRDQARQAAVSKLGCSSP